MKRVSNIRLNLIARYGIFFITLHKLCVHHKSLNNDKIINTHFETNFADTYLAWKKMENNQFTQKYLAIYPYYLSTLGNIKMN